MLGAKLLMLVCVIGAAMAVILEPAADTQGLAPNTTVPDTTTTDNCNTTAPNATVPVTPTPDNSNTTAPVSTTTPSAPDQPPKDAKVNKLEFRDKSNDQLCLKINLAANFAFDYNTTDKSTSHASINAPQIDAGNKTVINVTDCANTTEYVFEFSWEWNTRTWVVSLGFNTTAKNETELSKIELKVPKDPEILKNISQKEDYNISDVSYYKVGSKNSYKCDSSVKISQSSNTSLVATFSSFQYQAFKFNDKFGFGDVVSCDADKTSNIVPIVVGCVLAGMIVMVIIAYIVASRIRARSYEHRYETL